MSELTQFLKNNRHILRITALEKECKIYQGAITKVLNDTEYRHLTEDQEAAVRKFLMSLFRKLEKNLVDKK